MKDRASDIYMEINLSDGTQLMSLERFQLLKRSKNRFDVCRLVPSSEAKCSSRIYLQSGWLQLSTVTLMHYGIFGLSSEFTDSIATLNRQTNASIWNGKLDNCRCGCCRGMLAPFLTNSQSYTLVKITCKSDCEKKFDTFS